MSIAFAATMTTGVAPRSYDHTDFELKNIRELPDSIGKMDNKNPIYNRHIPTDEELNLLPKIKQSQIEVTRFIGNCIIETPYRHAS